MFQPRDYRERYGARDLVSFRVCVKETDLLIFAERDLSPEAYEPVKAARAQIEEEIQINPRFLTSLEPLPKRPGCGKLVAAMYEAAQKVGVGPMAAVAGAIAEYVAKEFSSKTTQILVENGGDLYIISRDSRIIAIEAGPSPLSGKIGLKLPAGQWGVCTSAGTYGHSLSFGKADAALIVAEDGALADAAATALGNRVRKPGDVAEALDWAQRIPGVRQALVIIGETLGVWGEFELAPIGD